MSAPKCPRSGCTNGRQKYNELGGYSVQCEAHNLADAVKRRARMKRLRERRAVEKSLYAERVETGEVGFRFKVK